MEKGSIQSSSTKKRLRKACEDRCCWQEYRDQLHVSNPQLGNQTAASNGQGDAGRVVNAVGAAFKSEELECRIRIALAAQATREAAGSIELHDTHTGQHFWDFDWWLTEATLRRLHSGIDAVAHLLFLAFICRGEPDSKLGPDDRGFPCKVYRAIKACKDLDRLSGALETMWDSDERKKLGAFVNHVKHLAFPERTGQLPPLDDFCRLTTIERFCHDSCEYGPWKPDVINSLIDGFRRELLKVLKEAGKIAAAPQGPLYGLSFDRENRGPTGTVEMPT